MNQLILENAKILKNGELVLTNIAIEKDIIKEISSKKIFGKNRVDCLEKFLMPGIIDCHVHFRSPGNESKEDWNTGSKASVSSGITTVLEMPNTTPPTTTVKALQQKRTIAKNLSLTNFGFHFGATEENLGEILIATGIGSVKVFIGKSTGDLFVCNPEKLKQVFEIGKKRNLVLCVHAEDQKIIEKNSKRFKKTNDPLIHSSIRDFKAETQAIQMVLELQKKIKNKLHICHVSTKGGVQMIREAKEDQLNISCEVTPHHLFLTERDLIKLHNLGKVNPSIKGKQDQNALWGGIKDETIDCVATDHAPHLLTEKKQGYWSAPSGMPGVETLAPLMLNAVFKKKLSLSRLQELLCENPSKIFGIKNKGFIRKDFDADLALFDLQKGKTIKNSELLTKCKWSAFNSLKLKGVLKKTIIGGRIVFDQNGFNESFRGKEVFKWN